MKEFHIISHTHRDREWYQSFEVMRLRLIDLVDNLLAIFKEYPDYIFHMDAQVGCLEDYLEIRPHRRAEIELHIREGRLLVGPWYVQNDFNLCSGEATVRNLLIGSTMAEQWGGCQYVGYAPDPFGLTGQLPQIYAGFGIRQSTMFQCLDSIGLRVQDTRKSEHPGELRQGDTTLMLQGTLSSRPYLKLLNMQCQNLLELQLEPLYAQLSQWTDGAVEYPADVFDYLWKQLQKNHAHDSICGCSADRVHQDNENRFRRILDAGEELRRRGLNHLVHRIDRTYTLDSDGYILTVVNTLPYERDEWIEADLHPLMKDDLMAFFLLDERGISVDYELLDSSVGSRCLITPCNLTGQKPVHNHRIRFRIVMPAGGYRTLRLYRKETSSSRGTDKQRPAPRGWVMQNEFMRVVVGADGQVDLLDSETGIESPGVFGFEDAADLGDSYWFAPDPHAPPFDVSMKPTVTIMENKEVQLSYAFGVTLNLALYQGNRHLSVRIIVDNRRESHRLRLLVHTDVHSEENLSSQPFDCDRHTRTPEFPDLRDDWTEPSNGLVSVKDRNKQFSVYHDGLYEYEHLRDARGTMALTLMRSTARIANDSGCCRDPHAPDPLWNAPENQCLRMVSYRLAIRPGQADETTLMREMQCFQVPLLIAFDAVDSRKFSGGHPHTGDPELEQYWHRLPSDQERNFPLQRGGLILDDNVVFSALKRSHDRSAWILRFFNPSGESVQVQRPAGDAEVSDLDERKGGLPWKAGTSVGAKKIITLRFE